MTISQRERWDAGSHLQNNTHTYYKRSGNFNKAALPVSMKSNHLHGLISIFFLSQLVWSGLFQPLFSHRIAKL